MADEFAQITEPLKREGMSAEDTTMHAVVHQATIVATYYRTLVAFQVKPTHALEITHHWMSIASGEDVDEDDDE